MNYKRLLELILLNLDEGIIVTDAKANITFYKAVSYTHLTLPTLYPV